MVTGVNWERERAQLLKASVHFGLQLQREAEAIPSGSLRKRVFAIKCRFAQAPPNGSMELRLLGIPAHPYGRNWAIIASTTASVAENAASPPMFVRTRQAQFRSGANQTLLYHWLFEPV